MAREGPLGELELDRLHLEELLVLLHERVPWLDQDLDQRRLVELTERGDHREASDELGDHAEAQQILGLDHGEQLTLVAIGVALDRRAEPDARLVHPRFDDLVEPHEGAAADEQDVRRVDLEELLLWMLPATLRRNVRDRAFDDLQERLLHALTGDVASDRRVLALARDLVDLVDVDDALRRALDVVLGRLEERRG